MESYFNRSLKPDLTVGEIYNSSFPSLKLTKKSKMRACVCVWEREREGGEREEETSIYNNLRKMLKDCFTQKHTSELGRVQAKSALCVWESVCVHSHVRVWVCGCVSGWVDVPEVCVWERGIVREKGRKKKCEKFWNCNLNWMMNGSGSKTSTIGLPESFEIPFFISIPTSSMF